MYGEWEAKSTIRCHLLSLKEKNVNFMTNGKRVLVLVIGNTSHIVRVMTSFKLLIAATSQI